MMTKLLRSTRHFKIRCNQRGVTKEQNAVILTHADSVAHLRGGMRQVWVSKRKLRRIGARTPEGVDTSRLANTSVLISQDGALVTVLKGAKRHCRNMK